jgi:hypothetical protein
VLTTAATDPAATDSVPFFLLLLAVLGAYLLWSRVVGRYRGRVCDRHGHSPDPDTIGTFRERCKRCGARIR